MHGLYFMHALIRLVSRTFCMSLDSSHHKETLVQGLCYDQLRCYGQCHCKYFRYCPLEGLLLQLLASEQALAGAEQCHCSKPKALIIEVYHSS